MFRLIVFLCAISLISSQNLTLIDQLRWDILDMENTLKGHLDYSYVSDQEHYLAEKFNEFDKKLQNMPQSLLYGMEIVRSSPEFLKLYTLLITVDNLYEKFRDYLSQGPKGTIAMEDVIYDITNNKTGVNKTTEKLVQIQQQLQWSLIMMLSDQVECKNLDQSIQQILYNVYNLLALVDLKCYILEQFSVFGNSLLQEEMNKNQHWQEVRNKYENRTQELYQLTRLYMESDTEEMREVIKCDPKKFTKNANYVELTRLLQGYVQNEADMNSARSCRKTCDDNAFKYTQSYGCYDHKSQFCKKTSECSGRIIDCKFVEAHASVCLSNNQNRRYDFIRFKSGRQFGRNTDYCSTSKAESWTRWFVRCNYCWCLCDEQGPLSDRYISLRPVMANITANRVVTGIRLTKDNRIIKLQIQEGQLLPHGYINQTTVEWKPVDDFGVTSRNVFQGMDYFTMNYERRNMLLNSVNTYKPNQIVTGVRYRFKNNLLVLEVHISTFDWISGKVGGNGEFIGSSSGSNKEITIPIKDVPILATTRSTVQTGGYIKFTNTDAAKDAAQTTVPFFDTQEVVNKPAVPLQGVGLNYKGYDNYGGFVSPSIKTYNFGSYFDGNGPVFPKMKPVETLVEDIGVISAN